MVIHGMMFRAVALLALGLVCLQSACAAPVSVAMGIDLGTDNSVVALARKRGVDIVANEASQRSTPSLVSFGHDQRYVGEAGASQRMMNLKNTIPEPKRLLAKRFSDPSFMAELKKEAYEVIEGESGEISVKVSLCGKERIFRPVQVIAMLLANLKKIAETDHGAEVVDVAISVPIFFTEHQRRAIKVAAQIAGLRCLRLINDNTATALAYGITKTDLPEKDAHFARHIVFLDCGRDCMQVSVVAFRKGELKVLSHAYSKTVSGRRIDEVLFEHFALQFLEKHKIDARTQDRARLRLLLQCEKLKKTLSACPEDLDTPINVECLMNDMDVSGMMNRLQLEELLAQHKIFDELAATCQQALTLAGIAKEQLESVELVGGTTRIPALRAQIGSFFNKEPKTTINAAESVARGASLACAIDSPAFKVRDFKVTDWNMLPVEVSYASQDKAVAGSISLKQGAEVPVSESLKLELASPLSVEWAYGEEADVGPDVPRALASHVLKVPAKKKGKQTVLAKLGFDVSGCVVADATLETQYEEDVPPPKAPPKSKPPPPPPAAAEEGKGAEGGGEGKDGDADMKEGGKDDGKESGGGGGEGNDAKKEKKDMKDEKEEEETKQPPQKRMVTRREKLDLEQVEVGGYGRDAVGALTEEEFEMAFQDRMVQETNDARNKVEEYVYYFRDALSNKLAAYEEEGKRAAFVKELTEVEEWLYGDGEGANKGKFVEKLESLQKTGEPISMRAREFEMLPDAFARLDKAIQANEDISESKDPKFDHISPEERASVTQECARASQQLDKQKHDVQSASKLSMPPITVQQVDHQVAELNLFCQRVMSKPKPAPPPKAEKAKEPAPASDAPATSADGAASTEAAGEGSTEGRGKGGAEGYRPMQDGEGGDGVEPTDMDKMD